MLLVSYKCKTCDEVFVKADAPLLPFFVRCPKCGRRNPQKEAEAQAFD